MRLPIKYSSVWFVVRAVVLITLAGSLFFAPLWNPAIAQVRDDALKAVAAAGLAAIFDRVYHRAGPFFVILSQELRRHVPSAIAVALALVFVQL